jgi:hypothetical protein
MSALRWLSPAVGTLAPIASCGGRACHDSLLPLFVRHEILKFCVRAGPPAPAFRCRSFAAPSLRDSRLRATPPALFTSIRGDFSADFRFLRGPGNAFRPLGDVRGRSRRRRSIGRPRLSMGLPLTRNASGAPFSRYRARKVTFSRIVLLRTTGPDGLSHRSFGARHPGSL